MVNDKVLLKTYQEILKEIDEKESHLLLGNGFNTSLGVRTDYKSIFEEMQSKYKGYQEIESDFKNSDYDLEKLIGKLAEKLESKEGFLVKFIHNKIKLDFMKATSHIASVQVNKVYQEKNEGIYLLLKNFSNYFTLNYDPFLYLLLMKFKENKNNEAVVFQHTLPFIEDDLNENQSGIYTKIKNARQNGQLTIAVNGSNTNKNLSLCTKSEFTTAVKIYLKGEDFQSKDIDKVVSLIWEEETKSPKLIIDDGFRQEVFLHEVEPPKPVFDISKETQNLFFLHGAFHIYEDGKSIKKITQQSEKSLYNQLDEIINREEESIICVFSNDNKINEIMGNEYLKRGYQKLSELSGSVVIIGCSLSNNDEHIFNQINKSKVDTIYISSKEKSKKKDYEQAQKIFNGKQIILFDRETISYEK